MLGQNPCLGKVSRVIPANTSPKPNPTQASPGVAQRGAFKKGAEHKWKDKAPGRALPLPPPAHHTDSGARMSMSPSVTDGAMSVCVKELHWLDLL